MFTQWIELTDSGSSLDYYYPYSGSIRWLFHSEISEPVCCYVESQILLKTVCITLHFKFVQNEFRLS